MNKVIAKVENLSHKYSRDWAIRDINFEVFNRGILGLLGSNGAGKSTTMNILCGVINQTEGNAFIDGINMRSKPVEAKKLIGFLPQKAPLHIELTVDEYLTHCAHLRSIPKVEIPDALERAKAKCGISHFSKRVLRNLSGGYQQRVGLAQAIIHNPKLVVLDEPTNGLDPNQIQEVRKLIKEIAEDRAVILSTHILSEVQATCDHIVMIEQGTIVFSDSMYAFNNYIAPNSLIMEGEVLPSKEELLNVPHIEKVEIINSNKIRLRFSNADHITQTLIHKSVEKGWDLKEIYLEKTDLDGVFAQLSGKA
ncbi:MULTISPECIES: ABC transporter ATP-binding protein [Leeuwenhoekiella]|uniref:ABC-2 type transport system ATP-binding protein n=3 Tax=Leeuwenhoekiella TaxID=283735 RepID=A0A1M5WQ36_9FLAO|nr:MULTISPECIES: ABC transporter ATP-binding protein [Leeuwenhoekiella]RXG31474.1 ABC-2 type transport system ATP-binding protein [Leeuwenhoekiella palythoae]RXG31994.1 ABC-2 type transport system ATP-binding protein [Leeuwenhoekiella marinoflava]SHE94288.1 ABC-2 type transport system ATP-binding protein [Leeuwenhoekiella marinoflava DSM 3653]SHH89706.1 ABC-2 type transport system ATP-binding protein [Leeuwenhoekiella palythoae]